MQPSGSQGELEMLKIEKDDGGCVTKLRLSGRIQSELIASIRSEMDDECTSKILDLREVTLVDLEVVRFLIRCEDEGIELIQCPSYIREWMIRERAEGGHPGFADTIWLNLASELKIEPAVGLRNRVPFDLGRHYNSAWPEEARSGRVGLWDSAMATDHSASSEQHKQSSLLIGSADCV
jgi:hypothetical protein